MPKQPFPEKMLPRFDNIDPARIEPAIREILAVNRKKIAALLAQTESFTFENLIKPFEEMNDDLHKFWSPIGHIHAVMETEALRKAYNDVLPLLTEYHTEISQNEDLYKAVAHIANSKEFSTLNAAQHKIIEDEMRDFKLSGIHLPADKKKRLAELEQKLSQLTTKFSENILDATHGWHLHITDTKEVTGLPEHALQLAQQNAKERKLEGYVFTLDYPSYSTAMKFLNNREHRKTLYEAYNTRASDRGPNAGKWDNTRIMYDITNIREEIAGLVGFKNYAEYSLATKMAKTPDEVLSFLHDLAARSKPMAETEYREVAEFAKKTDNISNPESWDLAYYSEKLRKSSYDFSPEDVRPFFPIEKVLNGLFKIVNKIYGITINKEDHVNVWNPHAQFFSIDDSNNTLRAGFYIDLYARPHKRDGAWMDDCRTRRYLDGELQYPVAYLTCNFMPPVGDKPALLTHDDVITLFHEFGHCLHHMLTTVDYPSVAGINGVPWDAVEFPSQFMENYCWEKESLDLIAAHYQTGEPLPDSLYQKMTAAKYFQTGMQMVRQLEFSLFDFRLHLEFDPKIPDQIQTILNQVRKETAVIRVPEFNRFQHSFSHVFAGGYAAGYYSYKWAEVLSCDAYEKFEENGIFDPATGHSFMENILEVGGVRDPMQSFIAFRGRKPKIDALLRLSGITS
jgi:oligopeptidase A